jgi:hypothetical protein
MNAAYTKKDIADVCKVLRINPERLIELRINHHDITIVVTREAEVRGETRLVGSVAYTSEIQ